MSSEATVKRRSRTRDALRPTEISVPAASPTEEYHCDQGHVHVAYRTFSQCSSPLWMHAANPFICHHYRGELTLKHGAVSLFALHNEFVNFWTHAIAFVFVVMFGLFVNFSIIPSTLDISRTHHFIAVVLLNINFLGCLSCLGFSALFHGFLCCGSHRYTFLSRLDYTGISLILVGSVLPPYWVAFHCFPWYFVLYAGVLIISGAVILILPWHPEFSSPRFAAGRSIAYAVMSSQAVIPLFHASKLALPEMGDILGLFALEFACYGIGALIYVAKFPERRFPGRFDLVGSSHQIFHLFVVAAIFAHLAGVSRLITVMSEVDCAVVTAFGSGLW